MIDFSCRNGATRDLSTPTVLHYNTKSNKTKISKTHGGKNVVLYRKKIGKVPKCGDTGVRLHGIQPSRPREMSQLTKRKKTVSRAYGGCLGGAAVRQRIIRAFLVEEHKIATKIYRCNSGIPPALDSGVPNTLPHN